MIGRWVCTKTCATWRALRLFDQPMPFDSYQPGGAMSTRTTVPNLDVSAWCVDRMGACLLSVVDDRAILGNTDSKERTSKIPAKGLPGRASEVARSETHHLSKHPIGCRGVEQWAASLDFSQHRSLGAIHRGSDHPHVERKESSSHFTL